MIHLAQSDKTKTITSIVSESFPHLRRGAMRDFLNIMQEHSYFIEARWDKTNSIYTFETGSIMEFFSADQSEKLRGGRRDRLFINEVNNITQTAFEELEVRTRDIIYIDWNPTNEFWFYDEIMNRRTDVEHIILTYKDNEALDINTVKSIEQRKNRKQWWLVYGLGLLGEVEGRIYTNWKIIEEIPHEARLVRRGMDFGYTNDPSAIIDIYSYNGGFILDEQLYQKGLHNKPLADFILNLEEPQILVVADSAEPKSIDEIRSYGVNIIGCKKGKNLRNQGIDFIQQQKISITKRSFNALKEYHNYLWDKEGKAKNVPQEGFDHLMDAIRYGFDRYKPLILNTYKQPDYIPLSEFEYKGEQRQLTPNINPDFELDKINDRF